MQPSLKIQEIKAALLQMPNLQVILNEMNQEIEVETQNKIAFYNKIKESDKAEFIQGVPVFHSPTRAIHSRVLLKLTIAITKYLLENNVGEIFVEQSMIEFGRNSYMPDLIFYPSDISKKINNNTLLFPIPTMIVEVLSPSTEKTDRGNKMNDYAQYNVNEYVIIDAENGVLEQYCLTNTKYELALKSSNGTYQSTAIAGFKLEITKLFND